MADTTPKPNIPGPAPGAADANANAAQSAPGGTTQQQPDPTKPTDPDPLNSVGGPNPAQPAVQSGTVGSSRGTLPSEGVGYSPEPDEKSGEADSDKVGYTQAVQRLASPDTGHDMARALGTIVNIPPGSRPSMIDPDTGHGVLPPQDGEPEPPQNKGQDPETGLK